MIIIIITTTTIIIIITIKENFNNNNNIQYRNNIGKSRFLVKKPRFILRKIAIFAL